MATTWLFNHNWHYTPHHVDAAAPDHLFEHVTLPHTNILLPHNHFHDEAYQFISTYRKRFDLPEPAGDQRIYLDFDGAMIAATVTLNGHTFAEHKGGYTPFTLEITDVVQAADNVLTVHLDSTERADIPPFGYVVDYLTFGGIYRDVHLRYASPQHISNAQVRTAAVLTDTPSVAVDAYLANHADTAVGTAVDVVLADQDGTEIARQTTSFDLPAQTHAQSVTLAMTLTDPVTLWDVDTPTLYTAHIMLRQGDVTHDTYTVRFGFREAVFREDGFYLNGRRLVLRGLNRHQTYPYIGAAAPARLQQRDADILKHELACNIVRTSHYPQSPHFLDRCDEIGLLVFEEIPGWQHIGDTDWKQLSLRDVRAMIERDWNHPSIILWGVRINESGDDTEFYTATNQLAHDLDATRQTSGVRFWPHSDFLEDVYGFNDFSNDVIEPTHTPWLITEFNGHMFPTKPYDNEERQIEHALRHARIHSKASQMGGVAGAIGWCAFDYNTHREFGSGDRICHHGVMDMFRLPKYAAYAYASQADPDERIVLQAATLWSMGDRSGGGNDPVYIFTNCDAIQAFAGEQQIGSGMIARAADEFPGLPQPPFKITQLGMRWGRDFGDLRIVGLRNGDVVAEQKIAADGQIDRLLLEPDAATLIADGMDMTRIVFKLVDRYGNRLPHANRVIQFEIEGPADLIGENPFALIGGQAALYVRARQQVGRVTITASAPGLDAVTASINMAEPR